MYVFYNEGVYDIKLNVNETTPENLRVFAVYTLKGGVRKYGVIEGDEEKINEIKGKLIRKLEENI